MSLKHFKDHFSNTLINDPTEIQKALDPIKKVTEPHDVLIVYDANWSPLIAYYAERRALMVPNWLLDSETRIQTSISRILPPFRLGGILTCGKSDELSEVKKLIKSHQAIVPPITGTAGECHFNFYAVPKKN